jgi:hypothetical protein
MSTGAIERTRSRLLRDPAIVGIVGTSAVILLHVRDPHGAGSYGFCPFLELTGRPCAGCGGLRAINDLTHGDVAGALSSNALAVAFLVILVVMWALWAVRRARGTDDRMLVVGDRTLLLVLVAALVFGVVRNTPWGAALAP